ncbi:UDP-Glycosyltransferase/glycogen phosphorylase [Meredithblackwellia eburnea MCA 4105]
MKENILVRHPSLGISKNFPYMPPNQSMEFEQFTWTAPFQQLLAQHEKTILFVLPWVAFGGADRAALNMLRMYAAEGYRVTVLATFHEPPVSISLRPYFLQYTHDFHIMPTFLRIQDMPRFIKHIVESRGIEEVLILGSMLMYEMLPALTQQLPYVRFIDYVHNEEESWKAGGYPRYSILFQDYLARTVSGSDMLRQWMIDRGHTASRIGVAKLGIPYDEYTPATEAERAAAKKHLLGLPEDTLVVTVVARLDARKRSIIVPLIAREIQRIGTKQNFQIIMLGDGVAYGAVRQRVTEMGLDKVVRLLGDTNDVPRYLVATDILIQPSCREGTSLAVAEAFAMSIPAVAVHAGAVPELVGEGEDLGAFLVHQTLNHEPGPELITAFDEGDAKLYAESIALLLNDATLRSTMGANGRRRVATTFDQKVTLTGLFEEIRISKNKGAHGSVPLLRDFPAYMALENMLHEYGVQSDSQMVTINMYKKPF